MAGPGRTGVAPRPPVERFLGLIAVDGTGCWIWQGTEKAGGYGGFTIPGASVFAHRWSQEFWNGPIPAGHEVDHLCRVRRCVNPDHLEAVPKAENNRRSNSPTAINARKTRCPQGHPYEGHNLMVSPQGYRSCRACHNARRNAKRREARAAS